MDKLHPSRIVKCKIFHELGKSSWHLNQYKKKRLLLYLPLHYLEVVKRDFKQTHLQAATIYKVSKIQVLDLGIHKLKKVEKAQTWSPKLHTVSSDEDSFSGLKKWFAIFCCTLLGFLFCHAFFVFHLWIYPLFWHSTCFRPEAHLWHQVIPSEVLLVPVHRVLYQHFQPCLKGSRSHGERWSSAPEQSPWSLLLPAAPHGITHSHKHTRPFTQPQGTQSHGQGSKWSNPYGNTSLKQGTLPDSSECLLKMSDFHPFLNTSPFKKKDNTGRYFLNTS